MKVPSRGCGWKQHGEDSREYTPLDRQQCAVTSRDLETVAWTWIWFTQYLRFKHLNLYFENFRILFTTTLHEGEHTKINLKGIESSTMELILQYIYMRQIDLNIDNSLDIMRVADYLCIDGLVQLCHDFIVECLGVSNCVTVLQFAE